MKKLHITMLLACMALSSNAQIVDMFGDTVKSKFNDRDIKEVGVSAQKRTVKADIDKLTYSVTDDPEANTLTALEVLRKVPMVTVDGDDNIQVNGSSSFKVYVNGKPNQMISANPSEILKSFPAAAIKKIEVITDPGAKYDAEGVAGVLNIVTEQESSQRGWTVTPRIEANNHGVDGGILGLFQFGKFTLSANYGCGKMKMSKTSATSDVTFHNNDLFHHLNDYTVGRPNIFYNFGSLEASYEFSKNDLISVSGGVHGHKMNSTFDNTTSMFDKDETLLYRYDQSYHMNNKNLGYNAGADYQHTFGKENQSLTVSYRFDSSPSNNYQERVYDFNNVVGRVYLPTLTNVKIAPNNKSYEHTAQVDFTSPIGKYNTLSVGGKYISRINESDSKEYNSTPTDLTWQIHEPKCLHYKHHNNILAAYTEYTLKVKQFSARAGLRYEHSMVDVKYPDGKRTGFEKNFNDVVPSVNLAYNFKPTEMLKFVYNKRIARPAIDMLSPYEDTSVPTQLTYGNPSLGSEDGHNFSLAYSLFQMKFSMSATVSYNFSNNGLTNYTFLDGNCVNVTYDNLLNRRAAGLALFLNWNLSKTTALTINGNGNYQYFSMDKTHDKNDGITGMVFANLRQDLPWKLKLGIMGGGGNGGLNLQGKGDNWYFYNISLTRSFLKEDRLTLTVKAGNFAPVRRHWNQTTETEGYHSFKSTNINHMRLSIGISWRLGKLQTAVKKTARTIENDDKATNSNDSQGGMGGGQGTGF